VPAAGRDRDPGALQALMEYLAEHHSAAYLARGQELAFLANTLVAACELQASPFTPAQAVRAALATCNLGLQRQPAPPGLDYLVDRGLVTLFEDGWAALHREVSLFVAEGLLAALSTLRAGDSETLDGLHALHRSLGAHLAAGTPWLARDDLEVLAILDMPTWSGLCGLLSECPVITDAVTAVVERRSGRIDPEAFAFIGTNAQIELVRAFVARLPRQLAA
jgi:hypothetical protein